MTKPDKNPYFISHETMDLLDSLVDTANAKLIADSEQLNESSSKARLSHLRGLTEARDAIYNKLPQGLQNGWDLRRTERSRTTGPPSTGGERAAGTTRRRSQRRSQASSKARSIFSAFNRTRHPRTE